MAMRDDARQAAPTSGSLTSPADVELLLWRIRSGDQVAVDELFVILYDQLHGLARAQRRRWSGDNTMDTTALLHEAYVKLAGGGERDWKDRAQFLAVAARAMRHVLVNYAERRCAAKRRGEVESIHSEDVAGPAINPVAPEAAEEILALHDALGRLDSVSERQSQVVECRFFAGLPVRDTAEALGVSPATVKRDWALASAWLQREIQLSLAERRS